jgi:hypothetical protein
MASGQPMDGLSGLGDPTISCSTRCCRSHWTDALPDRRVDIRSGSKKCGTVGGEKVGRHAVDRTPRPRPSRPKITIATCAQLSSRPVHAGMASSFWTANKSLGYGGGVSVGATWCVRLHPRWARRSKGSKYLGASNRFPLRCRLSLINEFLSVVLDSD